MKSCARPTRDCFGIKVSGLFQEPVDATPLTDEEKNALIPPHITYRGELNEAEQENIVRGQEWAFARRRKLVTERFVKDLHKRMFGDVWSWAGKFRNSEKTLGIPFYEIPTSLRQLLDDAAVWIEYNSYSSDEIAVRFSHRLVQIHPFPNGNGRHSRLMADLIVMDLGGERFTWGSATLHQAGTIRQQYIQSLQKADSNDLSLLLAFSRS